MLSPALLGNAIRRCGNGCPVIVLESQEQSADQHYSVRKPTAFKSPPRMVTFEPRRFTDED